MIDAVKTGRCQGAGSSQEVLHGRGAAHACRRGDVCPAAHPSRPGRLRQKLAPCWPQALTTPSKRQPVNLYAGRANERDRGAGGSFGGSAAEFRGSATPVGTRRAAARRVHSGLLLTGRNGNSRPIRLGRRMFLHESTAWFVSRLSFGRVQLERHDAGLLLTNSAASTTVWCCSLNGSGQIGREYPSDSSCGRPLWAARSTG